MAFGRYGKGSRAERELIGLFSQKGFSVIRAAGSGVGNPCPDFLAFRHGMQYGFECKAWDRGSLRIGKEQVDGLRRWEENTGITTMIAWRVPRKGWRFVSLDELEEKEKSYTVTLKRAMAINRTVDDLFR